MRESNTYTLILLPIGSNNEYLLLYQLVAVESACMGQTDAPRAGGAGSAHAARARRPHTYASIAQWIDGGVHCQKEQHYRQMMLEYEALQAGGGGAATAGGAGGGGAAAGEPEPEPEDGAAQEEQVGGGM